MLLCQVLQVISNLTLVSAYTHTCTHTHVHTRAHTHTPMLTHVHAHAHIHTCTNSHPQAHTTHLPSKSLDLSLLRMYETIQALHT